MKIVYTFWLLILIVGFATAQNTQNTQNTQATNQWIDFDKTYYKIKVAEDGIYRLNYNTLIEQGFSTDFTNAKRLSLINEGNEIPLYISDSENWGEDAYLEFYGEKLDGQFDQRLYENPEDQPHTYWSQFTDTAVYFLSYAEPSRKIIEIENDLSNLPEKEHYFNYTSVLYMNNAHSNGTNDAIIHSLFFKENGRVNSHFARYGEGEGWVGGLYAANIPNATATFSTSLHTPSIFDTGGKASIEFKISGVSSDTLVINDHHTQVHLNEQLLVDDQFDGYTTKKFSSEISLNQLSTPISNIEFTALSSEAIVDRQAVSYITINYPRSYDFDEVDHLTFTIENKPAGNYLEFENLNVVNNFYLYDLSNHIKTKLLYNEEKGVHQVYLSSENEGQRKLVLQNESELKELNNIEATNFVDYSNQINQGDYIILSHPNLINKDNAVNNYINYRSSYEGGAYRLVLVDVENLYDQYSYGIRKHPLAIKYFLNEAIENWTLSPSHCLLLGKALKNSKCRTTPTNWSNNLVPTFGDSPNDQYFGAEDFNPLSRIAIGRLSAGNTQDIQHYLDKVIAVEQDNLYDDCTYIEEAQWRHRMFHIGGGNEGEQSDIFAERLIHQADIAKDGDLTAQTNFLFRDATISENNGCTIIDDSGLPVIEAPEECLNLFFNEGNRVFNFMGHSSGYFWEIDIGKPEGYTYNQKYPIIISQSSFNGDVYRSFSEEDQSSMPETWLNTKEAGAVAFIGFDFVYEMLYAADFTDDLYNEMFKMKPNVTLGEQINAAIHKHYQADNIISKHTIEQLVFSGDPALKYQLNTKPEIAITEDNIDLTINQISDFYYSVELAFDFSSLNIASADSIPYQIILIAGDTETEVSSHWLKPGEQGFFKGEFTLLPNQSHRFRIHLDAGNQFDEMCEDNNTFYFRAGDWVGILDDFLASNTISNHPNPFSTQTTFEITLSAAAMQQTNYLTVSNLNGQLAHQIQLVKGQAQQSLQWNGTDDKGNLLAAGVYWYQLKNEDSAIISLPKKIVLVR